MELVGQLAHDGLKSCILKGQSNLIYYLEELRDCRTAGDIDIWVQPMEESGLEIAVGDLDSSTGSGQVPRGRIMSGLPVIGA